MFLEEDSEVIPDYWEVNWRVSGCGLFFRLSYKIGDWSNFYLVSILELGMKSGLIGGVSVF